MFGTFQEELEEEPPVYGTLTPANSWNPVVINYSHAWRILVDAWHAGSWWDKVRIWFMPLGWRPEDVEQAYPRSRQPAHERTLYHPYASPLRQAWSWFQFVMCNALLYHMLVAFGDLSEGYRVWYAVFLFVTIFSYTSLMDRSLVALPVEAVRLAMGIAVVVTTGGWFGLGTYMAGAGNLMIGYLMVSMVMSVYFTLFDRVPATAT